MNPRFLAVPGALLLMAAAGCGGNSASTTTTSSDNSAATTPSTGAATGNTASTSTSGAAKVYNLAFVCNNTSDYWTIAHKGVDAAQKELGGKVTVVFDEPPKGTSDEQTQLVTDLQTNGVDGVAISPVDPSNQTSFLNGIASQALLFTQDSDAPKSNRVCYIGTDNVAAGRMAGQQVLKALPNGGKIMVFVGSKDAQNASERYRGLQETLAGSKVTILDVRTDDADQAKAKTNVAEALVANPDLAGCVGLYSYNGPAILSAVKEAGDVGKVKIVCFDDEADTIAGLRSGAISATIVQQPFVFGRLAILNMYKYLTGDKSVVPANKLDYIATQAITPDTVAAYAAKEAKLLGK